MTAENYLDTDEANGATTENVMWSTAFIAVNPKSYALHDRFLLLTSDFDYSPRKWWRGIFPEAAARNSSYCACPGTQVSQDTTDRNPGYRGDCRLDEYPWDASQKALYLAKYDLLNEALNNATTVEALKGATWTPDWSGSEVFRRK